MNRTKIEYCDYTWNPVTGCLGPKGDGVRCHYCYAHRLANGRLRTLYLRHRAAFAGDPDDPFAPRLWFNRFHQPVHLHTPSKIFVCDMADLFGDWVPNEYQKAIINVARRCPQHTFQFLTKWPQNLAQFNPWPDNCWVGATATRAREALYAARCLADVHAPVHYLSIEPLLAHVDAPTLCSLDWVIIGAQTGPGANTPDTEWVEELIVYTNHYDVPIFLKNNLRRTNPRHEWPKGVAG